MFFIQQPHSLSLALSRCPPLPSAYVPHQDCNFRITVIRLTPGAAIKGERQALSVPLRCVKGCRLHHVLPPLPLLPPRSASDQSPYLRPFKLKRPPSFVRACIMVCADFPEGMVGQFYSFVFLRIRLYSHLSSVVNHPFLPFIPFKSFFGGSKA